ncbi:MAG: hypothetical protein M1814_001350 [Vezdaea aestivalis]|nr:MAG: hypothetical protein M1814_001350 [Vezdaea aestivalis]
MARNMIVRHYARIIDLWPKDALRPTVTFPSALKRRTDSRFGKLSEGKPSQAGIDEKEELSQINALYLLLDDSCLKRFKTSDNFYKPKSKPDYYKNLIEEIEQAPKRTPLQRWLNKWKGFLRFS